MRYKEMAFLFFWAMGCSDESKTQTGTIEDSGSDEFGLNLTFALEENTGVAGNMIGYSWQAVDANGDAVEANLTIASDLEPLFFSSDRIRPQIAGTHVIVATATHANKEGIVETELSISPGDLDQLDLVLSDQAIRAGEMATFTIEAADRFGNSISNSGAILDWGGAPLSVQNDEISSLVPGLYSVAADAINNEGESISDVELLQINPGETVDIELSCPDIEIEVQQTLSCSVNVTDAYGNQTNDAWTLSAIGTGSTTISYNNVTFWDEGSYELVVTVDGTGLSDTHGPIFIDSFGPSIDLFTPDRGAWSIEDTQAVSGNVVDLHSGVAELTINGEVTTVDSNGDFTNIIDLVHGLNLIETVAIDGDDNHSEDNRALLKGSFWGQECTDSCTYANDGVCDDGGPGSDYSVCTFGSDCADCGTRDMSSGIDDGMVVWIGDNTEGLGAIEGFGEDLIGNQDLGALLPSNPVYQNESESCFDPCFWGSCEICVTWYAITLNVGNPVIGSTDLDLDTNANGTIDAIFTVSNAQLDWWGSGVVAEIGSSGNGDITADAITVTLNLTPTVSNQQLSININSVNTSLSGFNFDMDGWLYDVLSFFGVDGLVETQIKNAMKNAIEDAVYSEIPPMLEDILGDLEIIQSLSLMNQNFDFSAMPSSVSVSDGGLTLGLQSQFTAQNWIHDTTGLGSLFNDYQAPAFQNTDGFGIALSYDVLNMLMYEIWGGGILDMSIDDEDLGIEDGDLEIIFPNSTDLRLSVYPTLPPVGIPSGTDAELQIGDLYISLHNGPIEDQDFRLEVYASVLADLQLSATATAISPTIGTPNFVFDVIFPSANSEGAQSAESLLQALIPLLLPSLTNAIGEIEIPSISGFGFGNVASSTTQGHLQMTGSLQLQ